METQELVLESLVEFCREPTLMVDLYVNYDCDVNGTNLFETLVLYLCEKNAQPVRHLNVLHLLALEGLLAVIDSLKVRCETESKGEDDEAPSTPRGRAREANLQTAEEIRHRKSIKNKILTTSQEFNKKPKNGIICAQEAGLLPATLTPEAVSRFLQDTPGLEKAVVGQYLGEGKDFNIEAIRVRVRVRGGEGLQYRGN